jgi:hypothetical protein
MGYRNYIGKLSKEEYNKIKGFTKEELFKYKGEDSDNDEMNYVGVYDIVNESLYELGKYVESFDKELFSPVFENEELQNYYLQEYDLHLVGKEFLAAVIDRYSENVQKIYNDMLTPFFKNEEGDVGSEFLNSVQKKMKKDGKDIYNMYDYKFDFDKITDAEQTALFKIFDHIRSMGREWGVGSFMRSIRPYPDLERDDDCIVSSWKYEYAQFELVRIYKTFDWEKDVMIYYGY